MPKPYHKNPRRISRVAFQGLRESLAQLGDLGGIIHDLNSGEIIGGNQRSEAFDLAHCQIEIGYRLDAPNEQGTVAGGWVHWQGERFAYREVRWTPKQCEAANIRANMQIWGQWDWDALANSFDASDLTAWGMNDEWQANLRRDIAGLGALIESEKPPAVDAEAQVDKAAELLAVWGVQPGDLWQCGEHRVICGDCTDREVVERVMDIHADATVTDPPYGIGVQYATFEDTPENVRELIQKFMPIAMEYLPLALTPGITELWTYPKASWVGAWVHPASSSRGPWGFIGANPILYYGKDPYLSAGKGCRDSSIVLASDRKGEDEHPVSKPLPVWEWLIERMTTEKGKIVFDPFGGSGTTMIACQNLGRRCRMIEIAPEYVSVILQRFLDATGIRPVLLERA